MDRITQGYIDNFAESFGISDRSDNSKLFERFATFCAISHEYGDTFDLDHTLVGDGGDCGIDGIAIVVNGTVIESIEEFNDIAHEVKTISDVKFIIVQAKSSSKFDGSQMATFGFGVKDVFSLEPQLVQNKRIKEKCALINHIYNNIVKLKTKPECVMYYVSTGKWVEDQNLQARIDGIVDDLDSENIFSRVAFRPTDADALQRYYKETITSVEREIELTRRIPLPEMDNIQEAYLTVLPATQFLGLITNDDVLIKSVLYDNVRDYQGDDNDVNDEISSTLSGHDANKFVVLNNGITIICKSLKNLVRDKYLLSGYQIVNGCQTTHVLYRNRSILTDDIYVAVKIISTTDSETINQIIKATNRQTEVTNEQMMSLNDFQKKLEDYYSTFSGSLKLYYERRSKQYADVEGVEKVRVVSIQYQIKAFSSMFLDKPHLASRYYGTLLKESANIFDDNHKCLPYFASAYLLYRIEYLIRNKQISQELNKYRYHLLMVIKYLVLNPKPQPQLNSNDIEKTCTTILDIAHDPVKLLDYVTRARVIMDPIIQDWNNSENQKSVSIVESMKKAINPLYR